MTIIVRKKKSEIFLAPTDNRLQREGEGGGESFS